MNILFVAGGTGGHVYPALSIAKNSKEKTTILHGLEKPIVLRKGFVQKKALYFTLLKVQVFLEKVF